MMPGPTIRFEPVGNPKFNLKGITSRLRAALDEEAFEHRRLLRQTTKAWEGTRPQFRSQTTVGPTQIAITTAPFGNGPGAKKWRWLETGTKIRWAVMSRGWRSKTRRAWLNSRRGRGQVVIAGKRAMMARNIRPRPGIAPRNWIAEVNKDRSRKFKGLLQRAFDLIARNTITPGGLRRP
jgi:hypothetical protein